LAGLESVRGMAAIAVVWSHAWALSRDYAQSTFPQRLALGTIYAIYLFFVMSGFLLFWPFAQSAWGNRKPISFRIYGLNRAWRVLPAYYVCLVILLVVQPHVNSLHLWLSFATFTQDFSIHTLGQVDASMQSLPTEIQFYILLPLIAWGLARLARGSIRIAAIALAVLGGASLVAREVITWGLFGLVPPVSQVHWLDWTILELFWCFALGMGLALWRLAIVARRPRWLDGPLGHSSVWLAMGVVLWTLACYRRSWEVLSGLSGALIIGALVLPLRHGRAITPFRWRWIALLGVISYSMYLWNLPVLLAVDNHSLTATAGITGHGMTELFGIGFPVTVAIGALSYWQIERRGLSRRRRWSANALAAQTPPVESAGGAAAGSGGAAGQEAGPASATPPATSVTPS
jgi:peptidoglycan/LPS O-acetylase OafA/YrhL